jgi:hypothetical protein
MRGPERGALGAGGMSFVSSGFRDSIFGARRNQRSGRAVGGYPPGGVTEGVGMRKIWLGVVVLVVEAVTLVGLVGGHVLQWGSSGLAGG